MSSERPSPKAFADASSDAYINREPNEIGDQGRPSHGIYFDGKEYAILDYVADPISGYHATAYKSVASPHTIIIAERGTDAEHFLPTGVQDGFVDAIMVRDKANLQEQAVRAFTQKVLDEAEQQGIAKTM